MIDGYEFWTIVDGCNPYRTIKGLCDATGLGYWNIAQQRSKNIIPKADVLLAISSAVNKSVDYLLTGVERREYPARIEAIARACLYSATGEDLLAVERILRLPSEYVAVKKDEIKRNTSSALA